MDSIDWLTNTAFLELDRVPEHLLIVGGSDTGLEYAQMHRRFGADVTVVENGPRLIGREDEDVSAAVRGILEAEGIDIRTGVGDIAFARKGDSIVATLDDEVVACSHVLLAVGRVPNTADLGRSEEHTSELQSLMRISYAVFCLKKKKNTQPKTT